VGHWEDIRRQARIKRAEVLRQSARSYEPAAPVAASELLDLVEQVTGVPRIPLAPDDPLLYGAGDDLDKPTLDLDRVLVSLQRAGGEWRLSELDAL
jgi:hypothetical protein